MKSKDPEEAGRNQGATGSFYETSFVTGAFVSWESGENPWIGMEEDAFSGSFHSSSSLSSLGLGQDDMVLEYRFPETVGFP
jgi:hypothetical protein